MTTRNARPSRPARTGPEGSPDQAVGGEAAGECGTSVAHSADRRSYAVVAAVPVASTADSKSGWTPIWSSHTFIAL